VKERAAALKEMAGGRVFRSLSGLTAGSGTATLARRQTRAAAWMERSEIRATDSGKFPADFLGNRLCRSASGGRVSTLALSIPLA
jgi:hypothetical protein